MIKCSICENEIDIRENNTFIINNVPDHTFEFSDKTIDLKVIECERCGCVQLYDTPISDNYLEVYRSIGNSITYREEKKQQYKNFIEKYNLQNAKILEVGCGDGQLLEIFRELGIECYGVEYGIDNYNNCINKNFNMVSGVLSKQYDALYSFFYLEHIPFPRFFVETLFEYLNDGGICLIEVPAYDIIEAKNLWLEFTKDHRIYYRKRTLMYLFLHAGFEIESIEENEKNLTLSIIVRKLKSNNNFQGMKDKLNQDIEKFKILAESFNNNFAMWGAGHYSQLILNNVYKKYNIKPKYIFDSNKQKCGNKINDTIIQYKDDITKMNDCSNIIICCGIYNNEVEKMLKNLNLNLEIVKWD